MFSSGNDESEVGVLLGACRGPEHGQVLEAGPAESIHVPTELQGRSAGYEVLWPKCVPDMHDFEQSSSTGDF